jgi:hypothetical protein
VNDVLHKYLTVKYNKAVHLREKCNQWADSFRVEVINLQEGSTLMSQTQAGGYLTFPSLSISPLSLFASNVLPLSTDE